MPAWLVAGVKVGRVYLRRVTANTTCDPIRQVMFPSSVMGILLKAIYRYYFHAYDLQ